MRARKRMTASFRMMMALLRYRGRLDRIVEGPVQCRGGREAPAEQARLREEINDPLLIGDDSVVDRHGADLGSMEPLAWYHLRYPHQRGPALGMRIRIR